MSAAALDPPLIIVIAYTMYPEDLFASIISSTVPVVWHIHYHGTDQDIAARLGAFCRAQDAATFFDHRANRGLSRSWNDSISSLERRSNLFMLINDDVYFDDGGFAAFLEFIASENHDADAPLFYSLKGEEVGGSEHKGEIHVQMFSCCAMNKAVPEDIGGFDENFSPAYYEDCDFARRMTLKGVPVSVDERTLCFHDRSHTIRNDPELASTSLDFLTKNREHYMRKWGGDLGEEKFSEPFDGMQD